MSTRLPGPWAGAQLATRGFEVTRLELDNAPDPFLKGVGDDPSFPHWQQQMAAVKSFHRARWSTHFDLPTQHLIEHSQGMIFAPAVSPSIHQDMRKSILGMVKGPWVFLEIAGRRDGQPWHDLNALAESGLLSMHTNAIEHDSNVASMAPPFLPVAGIVFGMAIALEFTCAWQEAQTEESCLERTIYLQDVIEQMSSWLIPEAAANSTPLYLHNGRYPCYRLYHLKDKSTVALAAIESRFWSNFIQTTKLPLTLEDRFDQTGRVQKTLEDFFKQHTQAELRAKINFNDICLSLVQINRG